jgi:hypothetical protein
VISTPESAFSPSPIVLKEGVSTRLVPENAGKEAHYSQPGALFREIVIRDRFDQKR